MTGRNFFLKGDAVVEEMQEIEAINFAIYFQICLFFRHILKFLWNRNRSNTLSNSEFSGAKFDMFESSFKTRNKIKIKLLFSLNAASVLFNINLKQVIQPRLLLSINLHF
jgi:hypothetical protein